MIINVLGDNYFQLRQSPASALGRHNGMPRRPERTVSGKQLPTDFRLPANYCPEEYTDLGNSKCGVSTNGFRPAAMRF